MSRKESTVGGDPIESTGSPVRGQDNQESEGMSASLNSGAGPSVGMQSTSDCQTPVSRQEREHGKKGVSSRTRKQTTTYSLNTRQQELAQKPRRLNSENAKVSKPLDQEGLSLVWYRVLAKGGGLLVPFSRLHSNRKVFDFQITILSLRTRKRRVRRAHSRPHTRQGSKSDQFALSLR